jgi:hypothetical protein
MSVQTNFRAEDMLGAPKAAVVTPAAEAKKITGTAGKKAAKPVEPVVEAVIEVPVVEEVVVEEAPVVEPVEESAE